jgi:hypothetical protein
MSVDTLVAMRDKDENRSFQPTLWLSSDPLLQLMIATVESSYLS